MKAYLVCIQRPALAAAFFTSIALLALAAGGCGPRPGTDSGPIGPICGNSIVEMGEDCDPPVGGLCTTMCMFIPNCGNDVIEPPEECDPPNGTTCSVMCRTITQTTPNIGEPCTEDSDCNAGPLVTGACNTDADGFPAGFCHGPGCANDAQCPTNSICVSFTDGTTSCYPSCTTTGTDNGGCRPETAGGVAYACYPLGTFATDVAVCLPGCDDDTACVMGFACEETTNVCVPDHPAPPPPATGTCMPSGGTCNDAAMTSCMDSSVCVQDCVQPLGACNGDALPCVDSSTCTSTCALASGNCDDVPAALCLSDTNCVAPIGSCDVTGTCMNDPVTGCVVDADCDATCVLTIGTCTGGIAPCGSNADCNVCDQLPGTCNDATAATCMMNADCMPACILNPGGCSNGVGACAMDEDCVVGIGDPCTANADCPQFAVCRTGMAYPGGFCTILYCGSFPGLLEFTCPTGTFCPAANGFNGGTVNFCTAPCTMNTSDPTGECQANRGDMSDYVCTEQFPDMSMAGLADFFDSNGVAGVVDGFCLNCMNYWADSAMCP